MLSSLTMICDFMLTKPKTASKQFLLPNFPHSKTVVRFINHHYSLHNKTGNINFGAIFVYVIDRLLTEKNAQIGNKVFVDMENVYFKYEYSKLPHDSHCIWREKGKSSVVGSLNL